MNIINQLGIIAISSRLKRLSDSFLKDAAKIYKKYDADFMMKWYPVLIYLRLKSPLSLAEIASALSYAHPSVIELINEMEELKLVRSSPDKKDGRKRMISLTPKSRKLLLQIQPYVDSFTEVLEELTKNTKLLEALDDIDSRLDERSFYDRVDRVLAGKLK